MNHYALTFVVKDRAGIVAAATEILYNQGFNIEDSSSTRLRDIFTMMLMVSHTEDYSEAQLQSFFAAVKLSPSIYKLSEADTEVANGREHYIISVYGSDKPGIVHKVTAALAELGANIVDLQTQKAKGAYIMVLEIVPPSDSEEWIEPVKEAARKIGTDITVRKLDVFEL
ncbi:MAG: ACT domain-containing protein [Deferribacteraceae bacterium]|nr:ACT domain-containing protein [Deferribacteraceae bacterium]